jgi:transcriptional regulator with XRE-family HTH domain
MELKKDRNATFGGRLQSLRKTTNRTLKEESELFDVSLNSVYRWEHDMTLPRRAMIRKIAEFYGVTYEWLLNGQATERMNTQYGEEDASSGTEKQLLRMFKNLSYNSRFKVLGYVERICVEDLAGKIGSKYPDNIYLGADEIL